MGDETLLITMGILGTFYRINHKRISLYKNIWHNYGISGETQTCMVHNHFCLDICTHLGVEVEVYSRKSLMLSDGVTVKAGRGEVVK